MSIFTEEIIRAGSAASLSSLLNRLDPVLRKTANLGRLTMIFLKLICYKKLRERASGQILLREALH